MNIYKPSDSDLDVLSEWLDSITSLESPGVLRELARWSGLIQFWPESRVFANATLRLFERFPDQDGSNGMKFLGNVFDYMFHCDVSVIESVLRRPSAQTTAILTWWAAWGDIMVEGHDLRRILHDVADNPNAPPNARETAQDYLQQKPERHPGLTDPTLPAPTWDEIVEWEQRTLGHR